MKFLILTDSLGNPRPFPEESKVSVEETFPYLLKHIPIKDTKIKDTNHNFNLFTPYRAKPKGGRINL